MSSLCSDNTSGGLCYLRPETRAWACSSWTVLRHIPVVSSSFPSRLCPSHILGHPESLKGLGNFPGASVVMGPGWVSSWILENHRVKESDQKLEEHPQFIDRKVGLQWFLRLGRSTQWGRCRDHSKSGTLHTWEAETGRSPLRWEIQPPKKERKWHRVEEFWRPRRYSTKEVLL